LQAGPALVLASFTKHGLCSVLCPCVGLRREPDTNGGPFQDSLDTLSGQQALLLEQRPEARLAAMITRFVPLAVAIGSVVLFILGAIPQVRAQEEAAKVEVVERAAVNPKVLEFIKPVDADDADDELLRKMKERHNVAVKLLASRVAEYRTNVGNLATVLDAARSVIDAKLDLAADREAQLAVYESALEVAKLIEQHYQALLTAGLGTVSDSQRAQLARVTVEVQILKLKRQL